MPNQVVHCKRAPFDVYIGRKYQDMPASKWQNPYVINKDGTRAEVIAKYEIYLRGNEALMNDLGELDGKVLGCWCKGTDGNVEVACHGDVLSRLIDEARSEAEAAEGEAAQAMSDEATQAMFAPGKLAQLSERDQSAIKHCLDKAGNPTRAEAQEALAAVFMEPTLQRIESAPVFANLFKAKPLACFTTHYSLGESTLTLEEAGKTEEGNPQSIVDIARSNHLKQVVLVESRIDGFLEAHKHLSKPFKATPAKPIGDYVRAEQGDKKKPSDEDRIAAQVAHDEATAKYEVESKWSTEPIQLVYGLKLVVCADMATKDEPSRRTESKVVVFVRDTQGYNDLIRIWNRAWTEGFYYHGRIDWKTLRSLWTEHLTFALPFFSSFIQRHTLTFCSIVPEFPVPANEVWVLREIDSGLPFASLIDAAVVKFARETGAQVIETKSIYYASKDDFDTYTTFRAIHEGGQFSAPGVDHLASDRFCFSEWQRLTSIS